MGNLGRPADATVPEPPPSWNGTRSGESPTSARVSRPPSTERVRRRGAVVRQWALPQVFGFFFVGWCSFFLLDLYVAFVTHGASILWLGAWRAVGAVAIAAARVLSRRKMKTRRSVMLEVATFFSAIACLSMIAVRYGGLASHYLPGISLVVVIQTLALPARWKRALAVSAINLSCFPVVMALAAIFDDGIRAQILDARAVALWFQDYVMVVATGIFTAFGGHLIWSARRQVHHARRLGRYRLKARIGSGGMGEVWLAHDDGLKRDVALKILARQASARELARFEREAYAASSLQSPHTIRVFDFGASDDGVWFIAMEHLHGADLATMVLDHGPLPLARAVKLARQACASLAEAHDRGIVHRDIKPANLFVTFAGDQYDLLKLLDFGIAKVSRDQEDGTVTQAGWLAGTPAYMSPEVCSGETAGVESDIYSLGAVLYFLITGTPPFTTENVAQLMMAHVHEPPEAPSQRAGALVPRDLENVILK